MKTAVVLFMIAAGVSLLLYRASESAYGQVPVDQDLRGRFFSSHSAVRRVSVRRERLLLMIVEVPASVFLSVSHNDQESQASEGRRVFRGDVVIRTTAPLATTKEQRSASDIASTAPVMLSVKDGEVEVEVVRR